MRGGPATRAGHGANAEAVDGGTYEQVCGASIGWGDEEETNGRV